MNDLFLYLAKVSAGLAIVFLPYYFLFRNDSNLVIKRFYLLAGVVAAWIFPFITFRKLPLAVDLTPTVFIDLDEPATLPVLLDNAGTETGLTINWLQVVIFVYLAGLTFMFLKNLFIIVKWNFTWLRTHDKEGVAYTKNDQVFTLFTRIFVPGSLREEQDLDNVLLHEKAHIRQLHFIDLMIMELTLLLTWFNPFSWLISRMIKENHEYLADRQVLSAGVNPARYRAQLMNHTLGVNVFRLGNQFNHSLTLKRFKMMKKPTKSPMGIIKIALLIPAVLITLGLTTGLTPQQKTVKGKVIFADTGEPAEGASVVIMITTTGCVVDKDGTFMLNVDGNPEIAISFVGYGTLIVKASEIGKKPLKLEIEAVTLDLGSVPPMISKESSGTLIFRQQDGSGAEPVIVVDGKEVVDVVSNLDPNLIESIEVIKDPDHPLIKKYNAKDGLILVTTKDGKGATVHESGKTMKEVKVIGIEKEPKAIEKDEEEVFYVVEDMPTFNGGDPTIEFRKYIARNLRYPELAAEKGIGGRVVVQFAVDKRGQVIDPVVVRSVDPALDKEAMRLVMSSPKWTPGKQRGKAVKVLFTFPFNFVLNDLLKDDKEKSWPFTFERMEESDAEPVFILDGKQVDGIESVNQDLIDNLSVIKDPDNPLVKKYNATGGLVLITTKEAKELETKDNAMQGFIEKDGEIFYIVEDMPQFPGGKAALKTYIYSNLEYPEEAKKNGNEGEATVQFMINTEGKPENVKVIRSTFEGFDEPAIKVIREMPDWKPGTQRGKAVGVLFAVTIKFTAPKK